MDNKDRIWTTGTPTEEGVYFFRRRVTQVTPESWSLYYIKDNEAFAFRQITTMPFKGKWSKA